MLSATQPLATGNLADIREAIDAFVSDGVPNSALISTKRRRGGVLTALIAEWSPAAAEKASDESQAPPTA